MSTTVKCYPNGTFLAVQNGVNDGTSQILTQSQLHESKIVMPFPFSELSADQKHRNVDSVNFKSYVNVQPSAEMYFTCLSNKNVSVNTNYDVLADYRESINNHTYYARNKKFTFDAKWETIDLMDEIGGIYEYWIPPYDAMRKGYYNVYIHFSYTEGRYIYTERSSNKPYIEFVLNDSYSSRYISSASPTSGNISKALSNRFTWATTISGNSLVPPAITSAVFKWRVHGQSTVHSITSQNADYIDVPANTFSGNSIDWCVTLNFDYGSAQTSDWYTLDTTEPTPTVSTIYPNNTIVDGSIDNNFSWNYSIATGSLQTKYDLQVSADGITWNTIRSGIVTSNNYATLTASELSAGDLYWRVRAYNSDNVASEWSDIAHIIIVDSPQKPTISFLSTDPKFKIKWQTEGQQGYEIKVDGGLVKSSFGAENTYEYKDYLGDGNHTVEVRIQNVYGQWSEWGSSTFNVTNVSGNAITLSISGAPAQLSWQTSGYDKFFIYRNDEKIAETSETSYVDNSANGENVYFVRGVHDNNGNYGKSDSLNFRIAYNVPMMLIRDIDTWISLEESQSQTRSVNVKMSRNTAYNHFYGQKYPSVDIGFNYEKQYSIEASFKRTDTVIMDELENALGMTVSVFDKFGNIINGIIDAINYADNEFYRTYAFVIREVEQ